MRVYIDESGNFIPASSPSRVSCVAAVAIPEILAPQLLGRFVALRGTWTAEPELKGSALSDHQVEQALRLMGEYDILAEVCALDVGHQSAEATELFRRGQAESFIGGLTPQHRLPARQFASELRQEWLALPHQLMIQMYVLVLVLEQVIRNVPNYYAQRLPLELGRFDWVVDPKDVHLTSFERLWQRVVSPILQTRSLAEPLVHVNSDRFDYSAFARFDMAVPEYLEAHLLNRAQSDGTALDLGRLFRESVAFPDSKADPGLQIADIVASAFTKALNGKLPAKVSPLLGRIVVEKPGRRPAVSLIALGDGPVVTASKQQTEVLRSITAHAKRMFTDQ